MSANRGATGKRDLRYIIIGAGMAGLLAGIKLQESGSRNFIIYEKGTTVGGTWRENRYPGLTCDVPAHAYTYSFEPNPDWSRFYAPGPEIQRYFEAVTDRRQLRDKIRFGADVTSCRWDGSRWHVALADGVEDVADVLIAATGVLHHPNFPAIPGLESFAGETRHSARWDDDVLVDGRRVGVIGNGSTGVQIVVALADRASELVHFQRSPQWIMPVSDFAYSDAEREAFRQDTARIDAIRFGDDYWAGIRRFNEAIIEPESTAMAEIERIVIENLEQSVTDPVLREKLRPDYKPACKRLVYSPSYYEAAQKPGVTVERGRIESVEPGGVRMADGSLHRLDLLVLATGFQTDKFVRPIRIEGRDGVTLEDAWRKRPTAYYAISIPDFPNFFLLNGPTAPVGNFSLIDIAEKQWAYIEQLITPLREGRATSVSARAEALADYEARRIAKARTTVFGSGCSSWYLDAEGVPQTWSWTYDQFADAMRGPNMENYDVR